MKKSEKHMHHGSIIILEKVVVSRTHEKFPEEDKKPVSSLSLQTGLVKQVFAVAGMSVGCILDGTVLAYSSPALPSLVKKSSSVQINLHQASLIGKVYYNKCTDDNYNYNNVLIINNRYKSFCYLCVAGIKHSNNCE